MNMFMDWKTGYYKNIISPQIDLQILYNSIDVSAELDKMVQSQEIVRTFFKKNKVSMFPLR